MAVVVMRMLVICMLRLHPDLSIQPVLHVVTIHRPLLYEDTVSSHGNLVVHLLATGTGLRRVMIVLAVELRCGGHASIVHEAEDGRHGVFTPC